jgi:type II secretory pathway pseudopilin PulG
MLNRAFTVVELLIAVSIFVFMTALLVARYGNFNQNVLLTNTAYDVALEIRTAQTYGLSIRSVTDAVDPDDPNPVSNTAVFQNAYGVHLVKDSSELILFSTPSYGSDANNTYDDTDTSGDTDIAVSTLRRGSKISSMCVGSGPGDCDDTSVSEMDITFKRPSPSAIICVKPDSETGMRCDDGYTYVELEVESSDNTVRTVVVRENGQISVKD